MNKIHLTFAKINDVSIKWINWLNNKNTNKFSEKKKIVHTIISQKKYVRSVINDRKKILLKILCDEKFIGVAEVVFSSSKKKECEIKYMIGDKNYLRRGIGTILIQKLKELLFNKFNIERITAGVIMDNIASKKVLQNNNFYIIKKKYNYPFLKNKVVKLIYELYKK